MTVQIVLLIALIALISSFMHGLLGFGYSMIAMSILPLLISFVDSAAIGTIALAVVCTQISLLLRRYINWKKVFWPSVFMIFGKILGIVILMGVSSGLLEFIFGIFLIWYAVTSLRKKSLFQIQGTKIQGAILGFAGGILGGMFNVSGPMASIYYLAICDDTREYSACLNFTFVPAAIIGMFVHILYGNYTTFVIQMGGISIFAVLIGTGIGVSIFRKLNIEKIRKLTFIYVGCMGIFLCINGIL